MIIRSPFGEQFYQIGRDKGIITSKNEYPRPLCVSKGSVNAADGPKVGNQVKDKSTAGNDRLDRELCFVCGDERDPAFRQCRTDSFERPLSQRTVAEAGGCLVPAEPA